MERAKLTGTRRILRSWRISVAAFRHAVAHEVAIREQVIGLAILVPLAAALPVSTLEHLLLVLPLMGLTLLEFLNSAIEATVDRISLETHPLAARAKDYANVAVVIGVLMLGLTWTVIAGPVVLRWVGR